MSWSSLATIVVALFAVGATCLPMDMPATDLVPPKFANEPTLTTDLVLPENKPVAEWAPDNGIATATDLVPPEQINEKKKIPAMLFVINVIAVRNTTAEDSNDVLHNDVIEEVPSEVAVPLALFLLVLEEEDENHPVSLDDVAKDLEKEGFTVEKVVKDGETRLVKVDLDSIESTVRIPADGNDSRNMLGEETEVQESGKLTSVRRKRHICLHCKLEELKQKLGGGYGGGCGGGCGGGGTYYAQPIQVQPVRIQTVQLQPVQLQPVQLQPIEVQTVQVQPVQVQPVQVQPVHVQPVHVQPVQVQPVYQQPIYQQPPQQQYYQPPQQTYYPPQKQHCNVCEGGGYGNGGGNAYVQASAQASASASASVSAGGYGR